MPDTRGSQPARYEDTLRARGVLLARYDESEVMYVCISVLERDAVADAVEALRDDHTLRHPDGRLQFSDGTWGVCQACAALARLDGLGG